MNIEVDYCPTSKRKHFFISVGLNEKEAISFDYTTKGHRILKQVLVEKKSQEETMEQYGKVSAEWDTIIIKDGKFVQKYHNKWIDCDNFDIVNGETWETVWERPISKQYSEKLLNYSRLISDNYKNLNTFFKEIKEFEKFISKEIEKYQ
jgi:hypothetical protein